MSEFEDSLFEWHVQKAMRDIAWEFKTLEDVVGQISEKRFKAILRAMEKRPLISVGKAYMDYTHE